MDKENRTPRVRCIEPEGYGIADPRGTPYKMGTKAHPHLK